MTLRGPADADRFRIKWRNARWYTDPAEPCAILPEVPEPNRLPAFTTIKSLHNKEFRKYWNGRTYPLDALRAARYVAEQKEHLLRIDDDGIIEAVSGAPQADLRKASNRGSDAHMLLEALLKGHEIDRNWIDVYAPNAVEYVDAIEAWWNDQRPEALFAEVVGINWQHGYACTSDVLGLRLRSFGDRLIASDWKTRSVESKHSAYETEGFQLAAAANVEYIFIDEGNGRIVRHVPPTMDLGVVISIRPDSVEMYEVDLDQAWEGWTRTCAGWKLRQEAASLGRKAVSNKPTFVQPALIDDARAEVSEEGPPSPEAQTETPAPSSDPFAGIPNNDGVPQMDRAAKAAHLRERILALSDEGKQALAPLWPSQWATFGSARKQFDDEWWTVYTVNGLRAIEAGINAAERQVMAPFPEPDTSEPIIPEDSPLIQGLRYRYETLPPNRRPTVVGGLSIGRTTAKQAEIFADAVAAEEEKLETSVEHYRQQTYNGVPQLVDNLSPAELLKAGRAAAKALMLPPPRKASDVLDDFWLQRAVS